MSRSDLESQDGPVLVDINDMKLDPLLTEALHKPSILAAATDFVALNDRFTMSNVTSSPQVEPKTLVIGWVRTKSLLVWPVFVFSILAVAIGVLES